MKCYGRMRAQLWNRLQMLWVIVKEIQGYFLRTPKCFSGPYIIEIVKTAGRVQITALDMQACQI